MFVSQWKTKLNNTSNLNRAAATEYMRVRSWMTLGCASMGSNTIHGLTAKRRQCSILTDFERPLVSRFLLSRLDKRCHWKAYLFSFPYICTMLNLNFVCDMSIIFLCALLLDFEVGSNLNCFGLHLGDSKWISLKPPLLGYPSPIMTINMCVLSLSHCVKSIQDSM